MVRFLILPVLLAACSFSTESFAFSNNADSTVLYFEAPIPISCEAFAFDALDFGTPTVEQDYDLLALRELSDQHAAEAALVLRDREDGLLVS